MGKKGVPLSYVANPKWAMQHPSKGTRHLQWATPHRSCMSNSDSFQILRVYLKELVRFKFGKSSGNNTLVPWRYIYSFHVQLSKCIVWCKQWQPPFVLLCFLLFHCFRVTVFSFRMLKVTCCRVRAETTALSSRGLHHRMPTPSPLSSTCSKAVRNHLNKEITFLLPTGRGERCSQTISNLGHAALLCRWELPL